MSALADVMVNLTAAAFGAADVTAAAPAGPGGIAHSIPPAEVRPDLAWAGWIIGLPAISAIVCALCSAFRVKNKLPAIVTSVSFAISFGLVFWLYQKVDPSQPVVIPLFDWIAFSWGEGRWHEIGAHFSLYVDELTLLWMLFVTGLATLIAIYASEYMESDVGKGYSRFFFGVSIFIVAMASLVMGDNLVLLYLGWEGVGLASYLLIGYYYTKPSAVAAAKKAFIMNRVGDLGLAIGIFLIWVNYGTIQYDGLFQAIREMGNPAGVYLIARMFPLFLLHPDALSTVAWIGGLTAFLAATIGMAQYDIKRVFAYSTVSQLGYMFLGLGVGSTFGACYHTFTHAFFKALLFLTAGAVMHGFAGQLDLRRLSGVRRVPGFAIVAWTMLVGCLWLSAFPFSAGFFSKDTILAAAMFDPHHAQPFLAWLGLATAALTAYYTFRVWFRVCAGPVSYVPGEEDHSAAHDDHGHDAHGAHGAHGAGAGHGHDHGHGGAAQAAATLAGYGGTHAHGGPGSHDGHDHHGAGGFHPHAPRLAINGVLIILTIGAVLAGLPTYLVMSGSMHENWVADMLEHSSAALGVPHDEHAHPHLLGMDGHTAMFVLSTIVGLGGILVAWVLHLQNRRLADRIRGAMLARRSLRWLPTAAEHKWYVDELYHACFRLPAWVTGHLLHFFDKHFIDGLLVNGVGRVPAFLGRLFQPLYNGVLQGYATTMAGAVALILAWVVWKWLLGGGA